MDDDTDDRAAALRFETRGMTPDETAAVTAVLLDALDEAASAAASVADGGRGAWVRSGGAMRRPLEVGPGRWAHGSR